MSEEILLSVFLSLGSLFVTAIPHLLRVIAKLPKEKIISLIGELSTKVRKFLSISAISLAILLKLSGLILSGYAIQLLIFGTDKNFSFPLLLELLGTEFIPPANNIGLILPLILFNSLIFCVFWHYLFFHFPIVMELICKIFRVANTRNFTKLIDYPYYLFGCVVLAHLVAETSSNILIPSALIKTEFLMAIIVLTLKFSKVSLEMYADKFFDEITLVRGIDGTPLMFKRPAD